MASFAKNPSDPGQIDVTFDATHCGGEKAVILYGTLGSFNAYAGTAQCDGGNAGSTSFTTGLTNIWFNIVWENGTVAGHPGYRYDGSSYYDRELLAIGLCDPSITADQQDYGQCP